MKKLKYLVLVGVIAIGVTGCSTVVSEPIQENDRREYTQGFEYVKIGENIDEIKDVETGVHYYIRSSGYRGGMCPVYNADGSLRVTK